MDYSQSNIVCLDDIKAEMDSLNVETVNQQKTTSLIESTVNITEGYQKIDRSRKFGPINKEQRIINRIKVKEMATKN